MKRKALLLVTFALILALTAIPAQAADRVINLIDEDGATWTNNDANEHSITVNFTNEKLVATAPGAWPWVTAVFDTPIVLNEDDNATINLTFTVADATGATSIRLKSGTEAIYIHHFVSGATYDGSGDIGAGTYTLSMSVFDLKAFDGTEENEYLGKKALVLDGEGNLTIDGLEVWCAGTSTAITVTVNKFEIVIPDANADVSDTSEASDNSEEPDVSEQSSTSEVPDVSEQSNTSVTSSQTSSEAPKTGDAGFTGIFIIALASAAFATVLSLKKRT